VPVLVTAAGETAAGDAPADRERVRPDGWWRMWREVADARPAPAPAPPREARACGTGFGTFLGLTSRIEPGRLVVTIPRFHDIERRLGELDAAVREDPAGRLGGVQREVGLVQERASAMRAWFRSLGRLPERVTHNDTKFNNILLDTTSGEPRAVIDLDTVMAGHAAYDFGDGARTGAVTAAEDTPHPEEMHLNVESFEAYADGFLSAAALTRAERETLPDATRYMTYIMAVRFLTDHIAGDRYYHIAEPGHNLRRARAQLALVLDLERRAGDVARALA
jgi:N-acetylhexosamine 1-kinase